MAAGNVDCPLAERKSTFPNALDYRYSNAAVTASIRAAPPTYLDLTSNIGLDIAYSPSERVAETLDNNSNQPPKTSNNNIELDIPNQESPATCLPRSYPNLFESLGINRNDIPRDILTHDFPEERSMMGSLIPGDKLLSINVDSEEESGHSWRPSVANCLSSDFFITQPNPTAQNLCIPTEEEDIRIPPLITVDSGCRNEPSTTKADIIPNAYPKNASDSRNDFQSYIQSQKAELNVLKYEVINARRRINESRRDVGNLTGKLNENLHFQNSIEIEKLTSQNARLRLECQCLCMEVDYYLKGQGETPLGEVDETFYEENTAQRNKTEVRDQAKPRSEFIPPDYKTEDLEEEDNKWECHKCTFANHPAINSCEMCHVSRLRRETPSYVSSLNDTCFCHPKEDAKSS